MHENNTEKLEAKLAFLEVANNELSEVVYRQQQEINQLRVRVEALIQQFSSMRDTQTTWMAEDEKPPHY